MKVTIKKLAVDGLSVGTGGMEIDVYSPNGQTHHGDLYVTTTQLIWCKGKTVKANGKKIGWQAFMDWAEH